MAEIVCDSKQFTVALQEPAVAQPRVEIVEHTLEAKPGQAIDCTFRVWNDGPEDIEITKTSLIDVESGNVIEGDVNILWKPNIAPGGSVTQKLSTLGWSPDMPAHPWVIKVEACAQPKGWF